MADVLINPGVLRMHCTVFFNIISIIWQNFLIKFYVYDKARGWLLLTLVNVAFLRYFYGISSENQSNDVRCFSISGDLFQTLILLFHWNSSFSILCGFMVQVIIVLNLCENIEIQNKHNSLELKIMYMDLLCLYQSLFLGSSFILSLFWLWWWMWYVVVFANFISICDKKFIPLNKKNIWKVSCRDATNLYCLNVLMNLHWHAKLFYLYFCASLKSFFLQTFFIQLNAPPWEWNRHANPWILKTHSRQSFQNSNVSMQFLFDFNAFHCISFSFRLFLFLMCFFLFLLRPFMGNHCVTLALHLKIEYHCNYCLLKLKDGIHVIEMKTNSKETSRHQGMQVVFVTEYSIEFRSFCWRASGDHLCCGLLTSFFKLRNAFQESSKLWEPNWTFIDSSPWSLKRNEIHIINLNSVFPEANREEEKLN